MIRNYIILCLALIFFSNCGRESTTPQKEFYLGADLSYINEMEDCGVIYKENNTAKDPYGIFADNGCNLVRLRLWHTPSWWSINDR